MESNDYNYPIVDATAFSVESIVNLVENCYLNNFKSGESKDDYYCGITNNLKVRTVAHQQNDFSIVDNKVFAWECSSAEVAAEVEKRLGEMGFDIGNTETKGNGGVESSCIVYLLKKGSKVN